MKFTKYSVLPAPAILLGLAALPMVAADVMIMEQSPENDIEAMQAKGELAVVEETSEQPVIEEQTQPEVSAEEDVVPDENADVVEETWTVPAQDEQTVESTEDMSWTQEDQTWTAPADVQPDDDAAQMQPAAESPVWNDDVYALDGQAYYADQPSADQADPNTYYDDTVTTWQADAGQYDAPEGWADQNVVSDQTTYDASAYTEEPAYTEDVTGYEDPAYTEDVTGYEDPAYTEDVTGYEDPAYTEDVTGYEDPAYTEDVTGYEDPAYTEDVTGYEDPAYTEDVTGYEDPAYTEDVTSYEDLAYTEDVTSYEDPAYTEDVTGYEDPAYTEDVTGYEDPAYTEDVTSYEDPAYTEDVTGYEDPSYTVDQVWTDPSVDVTEDEFWPTEDESQAAYAETTQEGVDHQAELNQNIADAALNLVGVTDGLQCTEVATLALANAGVQDAMDLWPDEFAAVYGEYTDDPQPGNLIYYDNGGRGLDHIAVYVGDGQAVHGNYQIDGEGYTVVANVQYSPDVTPQYIQVNR